MFACTIKKRHSCYPEWEGSQHPKGNTADKRPDPSGPVVTHNCALLDLVGRFCPGERGYSQSATAGTSCFFFITGVYVILDCMLFGGGNEGLWADLECDCLELRGDWRDIFWLPSTTPLPSSCISAPWEGAPRPSDAGLVLGGIWAGCWLMPRGPQAMCAGWVILETGNIQCCEHVFCQRSVQVHCHIQMWNSSGASPLVLVPASENRWTQCW